MNDTHKPKPIRINLVQETSVFIYFIPSSTASASPLKGYSLSSNIQLKPAKILSSDNSSEGTGLRARAMRMMSIIITTPIPYMTTPIPYNQSNILYQREKVRITA